jgi:hypothetical protein
MGIFANYVAKVVVKATVGTALSSPTVQRKIEEVAGKPGHETTASKKLLNQAVNKTKKYLDS